MREAALLALAFLAPTAAADVWFVDDDGGAGVDFTAIQPAIDAASPGDRIVVAGGSYAGFDLTAGLAIEGVIEGPDPTRVLGLAFVHGVAAGAEVRFQDLWLEASVLVRNVAGTLVVEDCEVRATTADYALQVVDSADVRVFRSDVRGTKTMPPASDTIQVRDARLELVQTVVFGQGGLSASFAGGRALAALPGSEVFVSVGAIQGGNGWCPDDCGDPWGFTLGGDGGDAIHVSGGASVTVAGPDITAFPSGFTAHVAGGWGGGCGDCGEVGVPGRAFRIESGGSARLSATPIFVGDTFGCSSLPPTLVEPGGTFTEVAPLDPSLWVSGDAVPGELVQIELTAGAGNVGALLVGFAPLSLPVVGVERDLLLLPSIFLSLGAVPSSESLTAEVLLPPVLSAGNVLYLQTAVLGVEGSALTNSNLIYVE